MKTNTDMDLLLYLSLVSIIVGFVHGDCNLNGPAGSTECVLLTPYYHRHQWATCLTNQYIETYSKGKHECRDFATYCWYQCMLEMHNIAEGATYDDCACGPDAPTNVTTQPTALTSAIPNWCFSPSGDDCSWYRECLEKRYPCRKQGNSYALDFAEKFCMLFQNHYLEFDSTTQQWIDAVRKCLQVKLVPILRPFGKISCEEIKQKAFDSHPGCYLHPSERDLSVCSIGITNWFKVFWTVKGSLAQEFTATFKQMLSVKLACGKGLLIKGVKLIKIKLERIKDAVVEKATETAEKISKTISDTMRWAEKRILYLGYPEDEIYERQKRSPDNKTEVDTLYINILIAARSEYDLNSENVSLANVSAAAIDFAKAVENGDVRVEMDKGVVFTELSICSNFNCTETILTVKPAPPGKLDDSVEDDGTHTTIIIVVCVVAFSIILIISSVVVLRKMRKC